MRFNYGRHHIGIELSDCLIVQCVMLVPGCPLIATTRQQEYNATMYTINFGRVEFGLILIDK